MRVIEAASVFQCRVKTFLRSALSHPVRAELLLMMQTPTAIELDTTLSSQARRSPMLPEDRRVAAFAAPPANWHRRCSFRWAVP